MIFVLTACGGGTPPPEEPKPPVAAIPEPEPEPDPVADKEPEPVAEKEPAQEDRRPLAIFNDPTEPVTIGLDGAVIRIQGGGELRIPKGALASPRNILFTVNRKHKGSPGRIGDVYTLEAQIPGQKVQMQDVRASRPVASSGNPFILKLPLPGNTESANLAVETVEVDEKGRGKSTWSVLERTKVETADTGNSAVFEIGQLPDASVHLTNKNPG
jgi:hypothetical protein